MARNSPRSLVDVMESVGEVACIVLDFLADPSWVRPRPVDDGVVYFKTAACGKGAAGKFALVCRSFLELAQIWITQRLKDNRLPLMMYLRDRNSMGYLEYSRETLQEVLSSPLTFHAIYEGPRFMLVKRSGMPERTTKGGKWRQSPDGPYIGGHRYNFALSID